MKKKWMWIVVIAYTLWIFSNSLMDGQSSSSTSGSLTNLVFTFLHQFLPSLTFDSLHHFIRKAAHFSEYALLGVLVFSAHRHIPLLSDSKAEFILYGIIIASIDETIQRFVPDRYGSIWDVLLDYTGYITGLLFIIIIYRLIHHRKAD